MVNNKSFGSWFVVLCSLGLLGTLPNQCVAQDGPEQFDPTVLTSTSSGTGDLPPSTSPLPLAALPLPSVIDAPTTDTPVADTQQECKTTIGAGINKKNQKVPIIAYGGTTGTPLVGPPNVEISVEATNDFGDDFKTIRADDKTTWDRFSVRFVTIGDVVKARWTFFIEDGKASKKTFDVTLTTKCEAQKAVSADNSVAVESDSPSGDLTGDIDPTDVADEIQIETACN
jgi:hypothetical protein